MLAAEEVNEFAVVARGVFLEGGVEVLDGSTIRFGELWFGRGFCVFNHNLECCGWKPNNRQAGMPALQRRAHFRFGRMMSR